MQHRRKTLSSAIQPQSALSRSNGGNRKSSRQIIGADIDHIATTIAGPLFNDAENIEEPGNWITSICDSFRAKPYCQSISSSQSVIPKPSRAHSVPPRTSPTPNPVRVLSPSPQQPSARTTHPATRIKCGRSHTPNAARVPTMRLFFKPTSDGEKENP